MIYYVKLANDIASSLEIYPLGPLENNTRGINYKRWRGGR